jgi:hypothetical protein
MAIPDDIPFRTRQACADLRHVAASAPEAAFRRMSAAMDPRAPARSRELARRLLWLARGKAPLAALGTDERAFAALLLASSLPMEDFGAFVPATAVLLLHRLEHGDATDDLLWSRPVLFGHVRLAPAPVRAAFMCALREARRLGRVDLGGDPLPQDCLTRPRARVLRLLRGRGESLFPVVESVLSDLGPYEAGALWDDWSGRIAKLGPGDRAATLAGFRYLYERPGALSPAAGTPVIPPA